MLSVLSPLESVVPSVVGEYQVRLGLAVQSSYQLAGAYVKWGVGLRLYAWSFSGRVCSQ